MANLESLPFETLTQILFLLSNANLKNTARVSRRIHDVTVSVFYNCIYLAKPPGTKSNGSPVEKHLRTLLTPGCEWYATQVRSLRWIRGNRRKNMIPLFSSDVALLAEAASRHRMPAPRSQAQQFLLLLHILPRLRELEISPPGPLSSIMVFLESFDTTVPIEPLTLPAGLRTLHKFSCRHDATNSGISTGALLTLLMLPSINSIDVYLTDNCTFPLPAITAMLGHSAVEKLRLTDIKMSSESLSSLLKAPAALTHFAYSAFSNANFILSTYMNAIQPLFKTLQFLQLEFPGYMSETESTSYGVTILIASLQNWPALQILSCSMVLLLGTGQRAGTLRLMDVLPVGIRALEILPDAYWSYSMVVYQLVDLLRHGTKAIPKFEKVGVMGWAGEDPIAEERLKRAAKAAGVLITAKSFCW